MRRIGTLLLLCLLPACNDVLGIGAPVPRGTDGKGGLDAPASGGSGGAGGAGASTASGGVEAGGAGGGTLAGGTGGAGGATGGAGGSEPQLPCDPGFAFSQNPITSSSVLAMFTGPDPWVYVAMEVDGPAVTDVSTFMVSGSGPYTWSWTVDVNGSGVLTFTFRRNKNGGNPGEIMGTCQVEAIL